LHVTKFISAISSTRIDDDDDDDDDDIM